MKKRLSLTVVVLLAMVAAPVFAQRAPVPPEPAAAGQRRLALVVNDRSAPDAVIEIDGRSYVELGALARVTNASVSVQRNRVVVSMPNASTGDTAQNPDELSKQFARAAIVELARTRAWKETVMLAIQLGVPAGSWSGDYRRQAEESLMLAGVAASTPGDLKTMELLQREFAYLDQWDNGMATTRAAMIANQSIDPNALQNDSQLGRISACQDFLSTVIVNGMYADDPSCR